MGKSTPPPNTRASQPQSLPEAAAAEYLPELRRFLRRHTRDSQAVSDLAQEVLLRLLRFPSRDVIERPRAYLFRVASNVARDFGLRTQQEPIAFDSDLLHNDTGSLHTGPSDLADQISDEREVEAGLAQLPPAWRTVLLLRYRDGFSFQEIAEKLGTTVDAVQKRAARGLEKMRLERNQERDK